MYYNLNDYEILYMVEDTNDNSFDILLNKYQPFIYKTVKNYASFFKKFGYDLDDLMQIGYITLYKASHLYKNYNNVWFYSYFKKSLNNAILSNIKLNTTKKKEVLNNALSYDTLIPNTDISYIEVFKDNKRNNYHQDELISFKNSMPYYLSWTFELFYNGYSKEEISILLNEEINSITKYLSIIKGHALTYKSLFLE